MDSTFNTVVYVDDASSPSLSLKVGNVTLSVGGGKAAPSTKTDPTVDEPSSDGVSECSASSPSPRTPLSAPLADVVTNAQADKTNGSHNNSSRNSFYSCDSFQLGSVSSVLDFPPVEGVAKAEAGAGAEASLLSQEGDDSVFTTTSTRTGTSMGKWAICRQLSQSFSHHNLVAHA